MICADTRGPTLLTNPATICPRCDAPRVSALVVDAHSFFAWHECRSCRHLWALPHGWTPHTESQAPLTQPRTRRRAF